MHDINDLEGLLLHHQYQGIHLAAKVTIKNEYLAWAIKGEKEKRKGCFVSVHQDGERPRSWGIVNLKIWGEGWADRESEKLSKAFWQSTDQFVEKLVTKKKFKYQTIINE